MKLLQIAITGPESTGKSTLAAQLAESYQTLWSPEYARSHLSLMTTPYTQNDVLLIAKRQLQLQTETAQYCKQLFFADTEMLVIKIWYEHFYGKCPQWLQTALDNQPFCHYLLTNIDLPWIADEQREHPHLRAYFFNLFEQELIKSQKPYTIISGNAEQRLNMAIGIINQLLYLACL